MNLSNILDGLIIGGHGKVCQVRNLCWDLVVARAWRSIPPRASDIWTLTGAEAEARRRRFKLLAVLFVGAGPRNVEVVSGKAALQLDTHTEAIR